MSNTTPGKTPSEAAQLARRAYQRPAVRVLGTVRLNTLTSGGKTLNAVDGINTKKMG